MAFTAPLTSQSVFGNKRILYGSYTNTGGSTGGDVATGLEVVELFTIQPRGTMALATQSVVNETLPLSNSTGSVTIVTSADELGTWIAYGT